MAATPGSRQGREGHPLARARGRALVLALLAGALVAGAPGAVRAQEERVPGSSVPRVAEADVDGESKDVGVTVVAPGLAGAPVLTADDVSVEVGSEGVPFELFHLDPADHSVVVVVEPGDGEDFTATRDAVSTFVQELPAGVPLGIVDGGTGPTVLQRPTDDRAAAVAAVGRLQPNGAQAPTGRALALALRRLEGARRPVVVLVKRFGWSRGEAMQEVADQLEESRVDVFVAHVRPDVLALGSSRPPFPVDGGRYARVLLPADLLTQLRSVSADLQNSYFVQFTSPTGGRVIVTVTMRPAGGERAGLFTAVQLPAASVGRTEGEGGLSANGGVIAAIAGGAVLLTLLLLLPPRLRRRRTRRGALAGDSPHPSAGHERPPGRSWPGTAAAPVAGPGSLPAPVAASTAGGPPPLPRPAPPSEPELVPAGGRGRSAGPALRRQRLGGDRVEGLEAVLALLRQSPARARSVTVLDEGARPPELEEVVSLAGRLGIDLHQVSARRFSRHARSDEPQRVIASAAPLRETRLDTMLTRGEDTPAVVVGVLGSMAPPQLGLLLRAASESGASGAVLPRLRRHGQAEAVDATAARWAAGAIETLPLTLVDEVGEVARRAQRRGFVVIGVTDASGLPIGIGSGIDLATAPVLLLIGTGAFDARTRSACDLLASWPNSAGDPVAMLRLASTEIAQLRQHPHGIVRRAFPPRPRSAPSE